METNTAKASDLIEVNESFPNLIENEIRRTSVIDTIERIYENNIDVVFIEGKNGSGKTTLLSQFARVNNMNAVTHFIDTADRYSYDIDFFKKNIYNQLYFYINNTINSTQSRDFSIYEIRQTLDKAIKKSRKPLYFIFDGLSEIPESNRELIIDIIADLPWHKVKFLISGDYETLENICPNKTIKVKSHQMPYLDYSETKQFLKDLTDESDELNELYKISDKGQPGKLEQIKRICIKYGTKNFLSENDISEKTNLFEIEWKGVKNNEKDMLILALLAFDDSKYSIESLSKRLEILEKETTDLIKNYTFISITDETVSYVSEVFRSFASKKLNKYKEKALGILIDYFIKNPNTEDSLINLPHLYQRAKKHKELINFLSIDNFATLLQKYKSFTTINQQFDYGLNASIEFNKHSANFVKFTLLKSSFREIERYEAFESEIDARIILNQPDEAYNLAVEAYLKEDRLRLLAALIKQKKINDLPIELEIIDQIRELYQQIDIKDLGSNSTELASSLLYSCPDLAIDLIENLSQSDSKHSFRDIAYTHLSLDALTIKEKGKNLFSDIDFITSNIEDSDRKYTVNVIAGILGDYNANQILKRINELTETTKKLFFLEMWILNNPKADGIFEVIIRAIDLVISGSSEEIPSATLLANIASPLPFINNSEKINQLVELFDSQKNSVVNPMEDYIRLHLILAKSVATYNYAIAKDRFIDLYMRIDEIKDVSIKTNCLAEYWSTLCDSIFKDIIETDEKLLSSAYNDLNKNLSVLIKEAAFHEKFLSNVIRYTTNIDNNLNFILPYILSVNTQYRRDDCYSLVINNYIKDKLFDDINFDKLKEVFNLINNVLIKERIIVHILDSYSRSDSSDDICINNIMYFVDLATKIENSSLKCTGLAISVKILKDQNTKKVLVENLLQMLHASWNSIDLTWYKVDIGFKLASLFAKENQEIAINYLNDSILERENTSLLDSTTVPNTYILSVKLSIRVFNGLIKNLKKIDAELKNLEKLIIVIPSYGEQILLWSILALNFYSKGKSEYTKKLVRDYIRPNLLSLGDNDKDYRRYVIKLISPTLYIDHSQTFFDYIDDMPSEIKDDCLSNVCYYLMTKMLLDEPVDFADKGYAITYEEAKDICLLVSKMEVDVNVFFNIKRLVKCLRNHKLVSGQLSVIKKDLNLLIEKSLPKTKYGIKHNGYKIAATASLYSLDNQYEEKKWNDLKTQAYQIPNLSDSVFVLKVIAEEINVKSKKLQIDILHEAYELAKLIPSNYEKFERFGSILESFAELSKTELVKIVMEIAHSLNQSHDEDLSDKHNELIDLLYQHDPGNIDQYLSILDNDIVKKNKYKKAIDKHIKSLDLRKNAINNFENVSKIIKKRELQSFAKKALIQLNSGKTTPKSIEELFYIIKTASDYTLSDSYYLYSLYLENIVKKYEKSSSTKNIDFLYTIFESTVFNANLIDILSQNNASKIKRRLKAVTSVQSDSELYFTLGERDKLEMFLRDWIENNVKNSLHIIDSYFSEEDIHFLKIIKEVVPDCEVFILTSKEGNKNRQDNIQEVYKKAWSDISDEIPPQTTIKIVWRENNLFSPIHDRWWIPDDAQTGLRFGTSANSVGLSKDTEISIMNKEEAKKVENTAIRDYIEGNTRRYGNERVKNFSFELD